MKTCTLNLMQTTDNVTIQLQKKLSLMFKDFVEILDQHQVNYFTVGGTLLGAVRHQGFIPWDDDIDIAIPRPAYNEFIAKAQQILPHYYKLETLNENDVFPFHYAKLYDTRTTLVANYTQPFPRGIYIDIFPLDGISSDKMQQIQSIKMMRFYLKVYRRVFTSRAQSPVFFHRLGHLLLSSVAKFLFSKKRILKKIDKFSIEISWDDAEYVVNYFGAWKMKEIHKKSWYQDRVQFTFDGFKVYGPKDYDSVLKTLYGDYMKLPPIEKQKTHHKIKYINLELPYEEYIKDQLSKDKTSSTQTS